MTVRRKSDPEELILDSALKMFNQCGLQGGRMKQIARNANTTKCMLVSHFANKQTFYA